MNGLKPLIMQKREWLNSAFYYYNTSAMFCNKLIRIKQENNGK